MKNNKLQKQLLIETDFIDNEEIESSALLHCKSFQKKSTEVYFVDGIGFFVICHFKEQTCYTIDCLIFSNSDLVKTFFAYLEEIKNNLTNHSKIDTLSETDFVFLNYINGDYSKITQEYYSIRDVKEIGLYQKKSGLSYSITVDGIKNKKEDIISIGFWLTKKMNEMLIYVKDTNLSAYDFPEYFIKSVIFGIPFLNSYYENLFKTLSEKEMEIEKACFGEFYKTISKKKKTNDNPF